ncbi:MAG: EAL domain-containing protein [Pseudonocardia sp.]|uniref:putative bifunctional diguanylate cyclase/phosphodiesterase n=1 Tax=unclassified Pseudonocardia TaxID=2619320 RepID=UPI00086A196A|nr:MULTISPECIES: GGDEF domain-containing phosphodiesterase [unclassified Pseudonocardia]MBN9108443.1 EAL domain-containing protein [Pseudonocardia sp.]ODV07896.1 MAG: hypothetical protein ABT15_07480 [Pseudonocardia sp. SCN 73-27]
MSEFGRGPRDERDENRDDVPATEAVVMADLRRSRQAVQGPADPGAVRFAENLARAIDRAPGHPDEDIDADDRDVAIAAVAPAPAAAEPLTDPRRDRSFGPASLPPDTVHAGRPGPRSFATDAPARPVVAPGVRETAFGRSGADMLPLPATAAVVVDRSDRIVRVNPAFARLAGRMPGDPENGPLGMPLRRLVVGTDGDARLIRADGTLARVRVVRWDLAMDLQAVVFVELGSASDARRIAELERMARVGTWTYELASATLRRSESLDDLYRAAGVAADGPDGPVEGEQVALLCQGLRNGNRAGDHHVDLRLPGGRLLGCRAVVERAEDGTPVRLVGTVRDLSAQRIAENRHRAAGARFADLVALLPTGVLLLDAAGRVLDANPAVCMILDTAPEDLRGVSAAALSAEPEPLSADGLPDWLRRVPEGAGNGYRIDALPLLRADGTRVWCGVGVTVTRADDGAPLFLVTCEDIDDRRRAAEVLRSAGTVDPLTRLLNRAAALDAVDRLLVGPARDGVVLVCGDLDDFARVNSSLGHEAGDDLLVTLAGRLQRELPFGCTAARLSGDEFVVICSDHAEAGGPERLGHIVAELLRTSVTVAGRPVEVTASVGLATPTADPGLRAADMLRFAEVAMQEAKKRSRGGVGVATEVVMRSATSQLVVEAELRAAIADDRLVLEYQPVVAADGTVRSSEALIRWPHPERGMVSPGEFLPVAQRGGLMRELDMWVLRTAAREAASWAPLADVAVAVNLAGLLPGDPEFADVVNATLAETGLDHSRLILELVETSLVALPPHALAAMADLVARGVRFAVDDFGTGYSSLARLKELPAQTVKVDRAFVTGIADDPVDHAVARAVVDMARAMGRSTVAEGVETPEQFEALRAIGVDAFQGWLFARPLAADAMRDVLRSGRLRVPASTDVA